MAVSAVHSTLAIITYRIEGCWPAINVSSDQTKSLASAGAVQLGLQKRRVGTDRTGERRANIMDGKIQKRG